MDNSSESEYGDGCSSSSSIISSCCSSESLLNSEFRIIKDWENEINPADGSLFYLKFVENVKVEKIPAIVSDFNDTRKISLQKGGKVFNFFTRRRRNVKKLSYSKWINYSQEKIGKLEKVFFLPVNEDLINEYELKQEEEKVNVTVSRKLGFSVMGGMDGKLEIDDWPWGIIEGNASDFYLKSIDGVEVTIENISAVLKNIKSAATTVSVALKKKLICLNAEEEIPIAVFYLKSSSIECCNENDLTYYYPPCENKKLFQYFKGGMLTINDCISNSAKEKVENCQICVQGERMNLWHTYEGEEMLTLAVPDKRCPLSHLENLNKLIVKSIRFQYGSLSKCFKPSFIPENLDNFFQEIFNRIRRNEFLPIWEHPLSGNPKLRFHSFHSYPVHKRLHKGRFQAEKILWHLSTFNKCAKNNAVYYPFLMEDYYARGASFYYKGVLIAHDHCHKGNLTDVHAFCAINFLLDMSASVYIDTLVLWKRVYAWEEKPDEKNLSFILLVGHGHNLLAALFQSKGDKDPLEYMVGPPNELIKLFQDALIEMDNLELPEMADRELNLRYKYEYEYENEEYYSNERVASQYETDDSFNASAEEYSSSGIKCASTNTSMEGLVLGRRAERRYAKIPSSSACNDCSLPSENEFKGSLFDFFAKKMEKNSGKWAEESLDLYKILDGPSDPDTSVLHFLVVDNYYNVLYTSVECAEFHSHSDKKDYENTLMEFQEKISNFHEHFPNKHLMQQSYSVRMMTKFKGKDVTFAVLTERNSGREVYLSFISVSDNLKNMIHMESFSSQFE